MIKSEEDLRGSVMCHEWMKEGCHLGQCTVILKEEERGRATKEMDRSI